MTSMLSMAYGLVNNHQCTALSWRAQRSNLRAPWGLLRRWSLASLGTFLAI